MTPPPPTPEVTAAPFAYSTPREAIDALTAKLPVVDDETVALTDATGRVLAEPLRSDRPSPSCDVSAMDGYALRLADLHAPSIPVAGEAAIGRAPVELPADSAMRIFTGGPVPRGAEAVVKREDVDEHPDHIVLRVPAGSITAGQHIRREGENIAGGRIVVEAGCLVTPAVGSAAAAFGAATLRVRRRLRVATIVTGDELLDPSQQPQAWELRDSNGPGLHALLARHAWLDPVDAQRVADDPEALREAVGQALKRCDALVLTGGVSMGDHDHVPDVLRRCGCETVFHKLPFRPGRPMLGAVGPGGQAVFGLPGNPVSVLATARVLALPVMLRTVGGAPRPPARVRITNDDGDTLHLHWFRPVRRVGPGEVELIAYRGSGDLVAAARSDGFVHQPPGDERRQLLDFYPWELT